jgi:hypothetical protein
MSTEIRMGIIHLQTMNRSEVFEVTAFGSEAHAIIFRHLKTVRIVPINHPRTMEMALVEYLLHLEVNR